MPSIWPASPPPWSRTRSPIRNGRAAISTTPAIRLPSVCCAARPKTTAVIAPPTASARGSSPAIRSAESAASARNVSRIRNDTVPAVPGSTRRNSAGSTQRPRSRASAQPRITSTIAAVTRTGVSSPNSSSRMTYATIVATVSGTISSSSRRAACARWIVCSVIERARWAGARASNLGRFRFSISQRQHCPADRVSSPPATVTEVTGPGLPAHTRRLCTERGA